MSKFATADCTCGWSLWREGGFTRREALAAWNRHQGTDCPLTAWIRARMANA